MRNWRASLPPDAPNRFLINVLPDQVEGVRALLERELKADAPLYPMVRGRLVAVNDVPVRYDAADRRRAHARLAEREFNLSWTERAAARQSRRRRAMVESGRRPAACRSRTASPKRWA